MATSVDKKVLHEFLERKGFNFAEDIDLAQLDRLHRKIPELAETPAQQVKKKKRKPDIMRILEGEDTAEAEDVADTQESLAIGTLRRRNSETAKQAKAAWAQETMLWEQDFRLSRTDLDKAQNSQYKDAFIRQAKNIYTEVDRQVRQRQQGMDYMGIFHPSWNAVRAESKKRVMLAKNLNYDEIRRISSKAVLRGANGEAGDEPSDSNRRSPRWNTQNEVQPKESNKAAKTVRQRQKEALEGHVNRRSIMEQGSSEGSPQPPDRKPLSHRAAGEKEGLTRIAESMHITSKKEPSTKQGSASPPSLSKQVIASVQSAKSDIPLRKDPPRLPSSLSISRSVKSGLKGSNSEAQEKHDFSKENMHATPIELLEVEDLFASKRRDIRNRSSELNDNLNAEVRDSVATSPVDPGFSKNHQNSIITSDDDSDNQTFQRPKSSLEQIGFFRDSDDNGGTSPQDLTATRSQLSGAKVPVNQDVSAHLHIRPEIQTASFTSILFSESPSKTPLKPELSAAHLRPVPPPKSPRRTRYLQPFSNASIQDQLPVVDVPPGLMEFPGTRALNPFYTTFSGPADIMLQAARSKLTPRIATADCEEAMQAPTPRALLDPIYRPDHDLLRIGTPDLDDRLKKEMSTLSLHMPMPNLVGDVDLLKLVGVGTKSSESSLFGPVPSTAKRSKLVKKTKSAGDSGLDSNPSDVDQNTADLAKSMMLEEGAQFVRGVSEADQKIMREERAGMQPPAPLDEDMAQRLEAIWEALEMPLKEKLGILVKYSAIQSVPFLSRSIDAWEEGVKCVLLREDALGKLALHIQADSQNAASETALRDKVAHYSALSAAAAEKLLMDFGDILTFKGMPYAGDLEGSLEDSIARVSKGRIDRKKASLLPPIPA